MERQAEQRRILELELQQARYEASLAERRYAACDPDNRLIAATAGEELGGRPYAAFKTARRGWTLRRTPIRGDPRPISWASPRISRPPGRRPASRCAPASSCCERWSHEIIADIDEAAREIVLTIHWKGGQHSELRLRKPQSGEHDCNTPDEALAVIRSMATRWSDEDIAATLNRMGMPTGQGKTWTAHRVGSIRRVRRHPRLSLRREGRRMADDARGRATVLGVTSHASAG